MLSIYFSISQEVRDWLKKLEPASTGALNLHDEVIEKKIFKYLSRLGIQKGKDGELPSEINGIDKKEIEYLLEVASVSFSIAQEIVSMIEKQNDITQISDASGVAVFSDRNTFLEKSLDRRFLNSTNANAHAWMKNLPPDTISFNWFWSLFYTDTSTVQIIVNKKVDLLFNNKKRNEVNLSVQELVKHAHHHTGLLESLLREQSLFSKFLRRDHIRKHLTAADWFKLLMTYKDHDSYRQKICDILLEPKGFFSDSKETSMAAQYNGGEHLRAIQNATGDEENKPDLTLLNAIGAKTQRGAVSSDVLVTPEKRRKQLFTATPHSATSGRGAAADDDDQDLSGFGVGDGDGDDLRAPEDEPDGNRSPVSSSLLIASSAAAAATATATGTATGTAREGEIDHSSVPVLSHAGLAAGGPR